MKIKRKLLRNSLLDVKTYFFSKSLKNIEKRVIYAVLEKKIYSRNISNITNENEIKTLKKSLFRQKFCLYTNCIYYTC